MSSSRSAASSPAARPPRRWAACGSSSRRRRRSCSRARASSSSRRSARSSSGRSATSSSRRRRPASHELEERRALQNSLGVPVERVDAVGRARPRRRRRARCDLLLERRRRRSAARSRIEVLRRAAELGVEVREHTPAESVERDVLVIACGPWSPELAATVGVELPIRPLCRQLLETSPLPELPDELPMVIEAETGFHFRRAQRPARRRDDRSRAALDVRHDRRRVALRRSARAARERYPPAAGARSRTRGRASTT